LVHIAEPWAGELITEPRAVADMMLEIATF
jgi:hypothetical protein